VSQLLVQQFFVSVHAPLEDALFLMIDQGCDALLALPAQESLDETDKIDCSRETIHPGARSTTEQKTGFSAADVAPESMFREDNTGSIGQNSEAHPKNVKLELGSDDESGDVELPQHFRHNQELRRKSINSNITVVVVPEESEVESTSPSVDESKRYRNDGHGGEPVSCKASNTLPVKGSLSSISETWNHSAPRLHRRSHSLVLAAPVGMGILVREDVVKNCVSQRFVPSTGDEVWSQMRPASSLPVILSDTPLYECAAIMEELDVHFLLVRSTSQSWAPPKAVLGPDSSRRFSNRSLTGSGGDYMGVVSLDAVFKFVYGGLKKAPSVLPNSTSSLDVGESHFRANLKVLPLK
jgi:CBS domain-containing protein